jgi:hypothetical protein
MFKKSKSMFIIMAVAVFVSIFAFPTTARASSGDVAAVTGLTVSSTNVKQGDAITFTIKTTAAANNVFIYVDGRTVSGRDPGTDAAGYKTWNIAIAPTTSQNVDLYVSATADVSNATKLSIPVTITNEVAIDPVATPSPTNVTMSSITETSAGKSVTLTFNTSVNANNVWVEYDNKRYTQGKLTSQDSSSKTWTIVFNPTGPQVVTVSANTAYKTNGATNVPYNVIFTASIAPPAVATISSATANPSTINYNSYSDLTIRTNADTEYVWVEYDNTQAEATISSQTSSSITWRVRVYPRNSQTMRVYANTADGSDGNEATRNVTVSVRDQYTNRATIDSASASWTNTAYNSTYATLTVNVTTNSYANSVWFNYNGQTYSMSRSGSYSNQWTYTSSNYNYNWNQNSSLTVYASEQSTSDSYAVSRNVSIANNTQQYGYIQSYPANYIYNVRANTQFIIKVVTSATVSNVRVDLSNYSSVYSSSSYLNAQGMREWDVYLTAPATPGQYTYYAYADGTYNQGGNAVTMTVTQ